MWIDDKKWTKLDNIITRRIKRGRRQWRDVAHQPSVTEEDS